MNNPMILWYSLVCVMLLYFLFHFIHYIWMKNNTRRRHHHKLMEITRERDMFYIPGDKALEDEEDN